MFQLGFDVLVAVPGFDVDAPENYFWYENEKGRPTTIFLRNFCKTNEQTILEMN